jgi:uridine kinase
MAKLHVLKNTPLISLIEEKKRKNYFCALFAGKIKELNYVVDKEGDYDVEFLSLDAPVASRIYATSIRYLVSMALKEIAPKVEFRFFYNISRSIFVKPVWPKTFVVTPEFVDKLKEKMDELIQKDLPMVRKRVSVDEAKEMYRKLGFRDKLNILKYRKTGNAHIYETIDGDFRYWDYLYSYMVPSTGYLTHCELNYYTPGFLILVPRSECDGEIPPFVDEPKFASSLQKSYTWVSNNQLSTVGEINKFIKDYSSMALINVCEARMTDMISQLGRTIVSADTPIRLICIAGPSSSGKTSFANRIMFDLMNRFLRPIRISMDDYFLSPNLLKPGTSLESVEALDLELFNSQMASLIRGETVTLPVYDFVTRTRKQGETLTLNENQPLIIEGIHALNPKVCSNIPSMQKFKIYIAPQPQLSIDNHSPLSLTDIRLLRRMARDARTRNTDPVKTIQMWPDVRDGEFKYIYPTQENADFVFDTFMPYELCAIRNIVLPLLDKIDVDQPEFITANRLKSMVKYFYPIDIEDIPCNSIMREFVGGSSFKDAR